MPMLCYGAVISFVTLPLYLQFLPLFTLIDHEDFEMKTRVGNEKGLDYFDQGGRAVCRVA